MVAKNLGLIFFLWLVAFVVVAPLVFLYLFFETSRDSQGEDSHVEFEEADIEEDFVEPEVERRPAFDLSDVDTVGYCPACGAGYRQNTGRCVDCGIELLPRSEVERLQASDTELLRRSEDERVEASGEPQRDAGVTVPFCRMEQAEALLFAAELQQAGIPFFSKEHWVQGIPFGGVKMTIIYRARCPPRSAPSKELRNPTERRFSAAPRCRFSITGPILPEEHDGIDASSHRYRS